ncbi:MAG: zinc ribbon domain-containing protein [Gracilimonas sp.]|uniref:FmdB family zinc ribbon protein n=1 Tax=Gracilimonas TaxID=649462 RepID=UPI001AFE4C06|nr:zinc ribbon domain-containing protein [Gracilimonas sp.]MBO6584611.1 zinc ribbon domain-containing protein [Gracilimonas sp.]MBO6616118.1 zinc ribbon domain-containing protein [Gracilimonas sp.]
MPTYEYKREDGTTFEIIQKMSEPALETCPTTGQKVKRIISGGGGVVYKGDGWYVTDYKNGGKKSASTPPAESSDKDNGAPETKAEAPKAKADKETKS